MNARRPLSVVFRRRASTAEDPRHLDDSAWLAAFRDPARREAAFAAFVDRYQDRVLAQLRGLLGSAEDAEDAAQEVFVKAWRKLDGFRGDSALYSWLYRVAHNEGLSRLRAKRRRPTVALDDPDRPEPAAAPDADPDAIRAALAGALDALPERQRQVFELRYHDEMPYAAIAAALGLSEGACKASYHHAVRKVEAHLRAHVALNPGAGRASHS
jgi:RNA polymerase sigma-70 factor (ECF subfamily)